MNNQRGLNQVVKDIHRI